MAHGKIIIANPRGFCAGVRRAIEYVEAALREYPVPLYCLHEIVHNRQVVEGLLARKVRFVEEIEDVPRDAYVLFSAHGVSPAVRRTALERDLHILDATCPFVAKVHAEVRRFARHGHRILLVGHRGHDEIVGVQGEAPERVVVIANREEARRVSVPRPAKVALVTQTTLSVDETAEIMDILRSRFPAIKGSSGGEICHATSNRQQAVKELASRTGTIIVLGSETSSNTQRLVEVAREAGADARLIDSLEALESVNLDRTRDVGLTAGASTPEDFISAVIDVLKTRGFDTVEQMIAAEEHVRFPIPRTPHDDAGSSHGLGHGQSPARPVQE